jgi:autotransporter adhesin
VQDAINNIGNKTKDAVMYDVDADGNRVFVKDANGNNAGLISLGGSGSSTSYVINNVAAGELSATSTQAVNGSQLNATNTRVTNVENRVTNIENRVDDVANGKAGLVQQQDPNGQITVGKDTGGTSVNFSGTSGDRVLTGVGAGVNANDAVNKGQLDAAVQGANQAAGAASDWIKRADAGSFGTTATATGANSVAVGQGSVADRDNSFSVGAAGNERQITNVAAGTAPTDAVNVKQLNDNIAAGVGQSKNYTDQRVGQVYRDMDSLRKDMYGGVASAMALANLPQSWKPGRGIVGAGVANYQGRTGFAAGWSYVTENDKWVVKAAVTGNDRSGVGGAVSAGFMY